MRTTDDPNTNPVRAALALTLMTRFALEAPGEERGETRQEAM